MFPTRAEYERFIYSIVDAYPVVDRSTLHFFTTSATAGLLKGTLWFKNGFQLHVIEVIDVTLFSHCEERSHEAISWF